MKQINLYQAAFRPPKIVLPARALLLSAAVLWVGLLALYGWGNLQLKQSQRQVEQVVQRADALTRQVAASAPDARTPDLNLAREAQTLEASVRALQLAQDAIARGELGSESGYSAQFRALARAADNPASLGAWLTGVVISEGGHGMTLQGRALNGADAARLIANLRREPLFVGMSFSGLEIGAPAAQSSGAPVTQVDAAPAFLEFSLHARLSDPVAEAAEQAPGNLR